MNLIIFIIYWAFIFQPTHSKYLEQIEQFIFINLDERTDRRQSIESELKRLGIEQERITRIPGQIYKDVKYVGASKSHIAAIVNAQINNYENVMILEDDNIFNDDIQHVRDRINWFFDNFGQTYDLVSLAAQVYNNNTKYVKEDVFKITGEDFLQNCYIVNKRFYETLLQNYHEGLSKLLKDGQRVKETNGSPFSSDVYWQWALINSNSYHIVPALVAQDPKFPSDNKEEIIEHSAFSIWHSIQFINSTVFIFLLISLFLIFVYRKYKLKNSSLYQELARLQEP